MGRTAAELLGLIPEHTRSSSIIMSQGLPLYFASLLPYAIDLGYRIIKNTPCGRGEGRRSSWICKRTFALDIDIHTTPYFNLWGAVGLPMQQLLCRCRTDERWSAIQAFLIRITHQTD